MPFTIPAQRLSDITCYVGMLILGRRLDGDGWSALVKSRPGFYSARGTARGFPDMG